MASLTGAPLQRLDIRHDDTGLHAIPADLPLRELVIRNRHGRRNLTGLTRWSSLRHLELPGPLSATEQQIVDELPGLRLTVT